MRVFLFFVLGSLVGCSGSGAPPESIMNSVVLARQGIDDFGEVKVSKIVEVVELMEKKKHNNVKVIGWSQEEGKYVYRYKFEIGGIERTVITNFIPISNDTVIIQDAGNPTVMGSIQTVRAYGAAYESLK